MAYELLISTQDLAENLENPDWAVIDCRFDLAQPNWGREDYQKAHIPGAVYAHLDQDLSGEKTPITGRHPLPDEPALVETFSRLGIGENTQVVVYDTAGSSFADRLWWLLHAYGHRAAAVLDGGFQKWVAENRPVASGIETRPLAAFHAFFQPELILSAAEVEKIRQDPGWKLIDARMRERFTGASETIDPVAGHIPGAKNRYYGENLNAQGTFKDAEQLRIEYEQLLGGTDPEHVVVYCGSGVTSTHHILAMELAGLKGARLYPGSWSEWIRDPNRPVATGAE